MNKSSTIFQETDRILLAHGSGGELSHELVTSLFVRTFHNPFLDPLDDGAVFQVEGKRWAFTTDSYVVTPIFFPGGDIGKLAVCGTVNDLSMIGAQPLFLSAGFIIEEGFPLSSLEKIVSSMQKAAAEAGVKIVTGDTKVVNRGGADGIFINTAGIGLIPEGVNISGSYARPGDRVILSGSIGDHGVAILSSREGLQFSTSLESDCASLNDLVARMLEVSYKIHCLRDPTRGGLSSTLNELARQSGVGIWVDEDRIPIKEEVRGACELLGFDPLILANEGRLVAVVAEEVAEMILQQMKTHRLGRDVAIIGEVREEPREKVILRTRLGLTRIVDMIVGEPLPRIC
ncbi:MAG: hydrogenase expression/formation protein HypE [Deltaproteobacteria bacterium]|nr:hydrogenase expression/formation protein HypE [Deltaproteobacteria bacterium]